MHSTVATMLQRLSENGSLFETAFSEGSMLVELYKPKEKDLQKPHHQDEIYVVFSGTGQFVNGDVQHSFEPGDVIFVKAGVEHRFVDFTDDFVTWVIFYGPKSGE